MIVRVLGSAAGGGVPQWNCACGNCSAARAGRAPSRTQSGLAVSADGKRWLLLNCSPDIGAQIEGFAPLQPGRPRGTPIAGMLFTDANVDHLGGLVTLRQSGEHAFIIRSSAVVRAIAATQPAYAPFSQPPHRWLEAPLDAPCEAASSDDVVGNQLAVRVVSVAGTTPGYDGRRRLPGAVVAYELSDLDRKNRLLFAPVFAGIDAALHAAIASAHVAFVDGTFYTADELIAQRLMEKRAESLGHQPVSGEGGTLERLRGAGTRIIFTHLNNSNPMLDPASEASKHVREADAEIAYDGMEFRL
ncbi:MAG TPA: MBL fold metallo-hydrolase [Candidatus Cybelea sp.]|nr:MBL fold metallo-hydrolase [Candidatus Cybelea sp.]